MPLCRPAVQLLALALMICAVCLLTGCATGSDAPSSASVVSYEPGDTEADIEAAKSWVLAAAEGALQDLNYTLLDPRTDGDATIVTARTPTDKFVAVRVKPKDDQPSVQHVSVAVDTFGASAISEVVMSKIVASFQDDD